MEINTIELGLIIGIALLIFGTVIAFLTRYKRCPSDRILVIYGRVGEGRSARCMHGGAAFVLPIVQDYQFLDLRPMSIDIQLNNALSKQNIRVSVPSTFTIGITTDPEKMGNAAERLLGLNNGQIMQLAKEIIFGQMRQVVATMRIEEINADRDQLIIAITNNVSTELEKVGLRLINVNIQDVTDESGYIDALGKEASAKAIADAKIKVAQAERDSEIGKAEADKEMTVSVAAAQANATQGKNTAQQQIPSRTPICASSRLRPRVPRRWPKTWPRPMSNVRPSTPRARPRKRAPRCRASSNTPSGSCPPKSPRTPSSSTPRPPRNR